jgi:translation initiation factor 2-alpha kinase 3
LSTFPTSANDSESVKSSKLSSISAIKPSPPLFEITFDRSKNPLLINEDFSTNEKLEINSISSSSSSVDNKLDANNNTKLTKSSQSSSSPLFDHSSSDSSNEKNPLNKEITESDDGIIFLHDEKRSSSSSPIPTQTKSLIEKKKLLTNEKDIPITYFYFVMELCQPESLRDRLTQRMIDRHQAWSIFDQIVKGIEYIHSQKLIHRDLKPSNILFSMENTVKIGDFGLVSAFGEDKLPKKKKRDDEKLDQVELMSSITDVCANNELGGTILYMSPEQVNFISKINNLFIHNILF